MRACLKVLVAALLVGCASSGAPVEDARTDVADAGDVSDAADGVEVSDAADTEASCKLVAAYSSKNPVCNGCAEARCCPEVNGCLGDPRCNDDYVNCILACALFPDDAGDAGADATAGCLSDCATRFPEGRAAYDTAIGCVEGACPSCR